MNLCDTCLGCNLCENPYFNGKKECENYINGESNEKKEKN